jgi:hypothetical protein
MKPIRYRVWYHLIGGNDPEQEFSMDVMTVWPYQAMARVRELATGAYITHWESRYAD